jgi:hypothetical protein
VEHEQLMLDLGTLVLIQNLRQLPLTRIWRLRFQKGKKASLMHGLLNWVRHHIRKELKSLKLLEQLQSA